MAVLKELGLGGTGAWRVRRRAYMFPSRPRVAQIGKTASVSVVPYVARGTRPNAGAREGSGYEE